jgi:hypothetical protein
VLTRLHARYGKDSLGDDLVFRTAKPIVGGRERLAQEGQVERGAVEDSINNFQGRYIIRHKWAGEIDCESPKRGVWGGPPGQGMAYQVEPAKDIAFAPRGGDISLANFLRQDVEEIDYKVSEGSNTTFKTSGIQSKGGGCAGCAAGGGAAGGSTLLALFALLWTRRRSSRRSEN